MTPPRVFVAIGLLLLSFLLLQSIMRTNENDPLRAWREEGYIVQKIDLTRDPNEKRRLIAQLEKSPRNARSFCDLWLSIHNVEPWDCWTEAGYEPERSSLPRDVQILAATSYGKEDIYNGGLHQFYMNGTGTFAPEMVEFFERLGNAKAANVLRKSMEFFGTTFPRSQSDRQDFLNKIPGKTRKEFDPFIELDKELNACIGDSTDFTKAKNDWLINVCKINRLSDPVPNTIAPEGRTK